MSGITSTTYTMKDLLAEPPVGEFAGAFPVGGNQNIQKFTVVGFNDDWKIEKCVISGKSTISFQCCVDMDYKPGVVIAEETISRPETLTGYVATAMEQVEVKFTNGTATLPEGKRPTVNQALWNVMITTPEGESVYIYNEKDHFAYNGVDGTLTLRESEHSSYTGTAVLSLTMENLSSIQKNLNGKYDFLPEVNAIIVTDEELKAGLYMVTSNNISTYTANVFPRFITYRDCTPGEIVCCVERGAVVTANVVNYDNLLPGLMREINFV